MTATNEVSAKAAWECVAHDVGASSAEEGLRWLAAQDDEWLLILDNADDPSLRVDLARWIPKCLHGNVIITTRNPGCRLHSPGHTVELGEMVHNEARRLLLTLSGVDVDDNSAQVASAIVEKLGCLALAVAQAGSFVAQSSTLEGFLSLYEQHRAQLLRFIPRQGAVDYAWSVYTTWEMNYSELDGTAQYLVKLSSCLQFAHIQWDIFRRAFARLSFDEPTSDLLNFFASFSDAQQKWDELRFHLIIAQLRSFSMINLLSNDSHSLHPLVHAWASDRMSPEEYAQVRESTLLLLSLSVPDGKAQVDIEYRASLLHHCAALGSPDAHLTAEESEAFGAVYFECSRLDVAEQLYKNALVLYRTMYGNRDPRAIRVGTLLVRTYMDLARFEEAEDLILSLLEIAITNFGPEHPQTLKLQSCLPFCCFGTGRFAQADAALSSLTERLQAVIGITHFDTMEVMQLHGYVLISLGRLYAAENVLKRAAQLMTSALGSTHPETLNTKSGLATAYNVLGYHAKAAQIQVSVVESLTGIHGPDHVAVLAATRTLAEIARTEGRLEEAAMSLSEIMQTQKNVLGECHPATLVSTRLLASVLCDIGRLEEANELIGASVVSQCEVLGARHSTTLLSQSILGWILLKQGRLREAQELLEGIVHQQTSIDDNLANIGFTEERLGRTYIEQDRLADGISLLQSATEKIGVYGKSQPHTLQCMQYLADGYRRADKIDEANEVEREITARRERFLRELAEVTNDEVV